MSFAIRSHAFHTCAAHFSVFLICLSYRQYPIRPFGAPSPRGEGFVRRYSFSTYACIRSDNARKAAFSYRSLTHWGRGTAQRRSGALVNDALVTIFFALFHTASPIQPPPLRGTSFQGRERPREPLPLEGAAERSEAGLASFWGGEAPSSLPSPLRKGDRAAVLGCSYIACLRRSLTLFHTASTLSAPSGHLPLEGKALCRGQRRSRIRCS